DGLARRPRRRLRRRSHRRRRTARAAGADVRVLPAARADAARPAMIETEWYRSGRTTPPADLVRPSGKRRMRQWLRGLLPSPRVRGRTMVLYCREGLRSNTSWPGMFSEFVSLLGALKFGEERGAAALRVDFRSPHYLDPSRGPNWWSYFFEHDVMRFGD